MERKRKSKIRKKKKKRKIKRKKPDGNRSSFKFGNIMSRCRRNKMK